MVRLYAESKAYGQSGHYVARIDGRDEKVTFSRSFVGIQSGRDRVAVIDSPGLYEICNLDKKGRKSQVYRIIVNDPSIGDLIELRAGGDNFDGEDGREAAMKIARRMDDGEKLEEMIAIETKTLDDGSSVVGYRLRSKTAAAKASIAVTVDAAVAACWNVLQALPEREAKKVLALLKARVSPPKPAVAAAEVEATDEGSAQHE